MARGRGALGASRLFRKPRGRALVGTTIPCHVSPPPSLSARVIAHGVGCRLFTRVSLRRPLRVQRAPSTSAGDWKACFFLFVEGRSLTLCFPPLPPSSCSPPTPRFRQAAIRTNVANGARPRGRAGGGLGPVQSRFLMKRAGRNIRYVRLVPLPLSSLFLPPPPPPSSFRRAATPASPPSPTGTPYSTGWEPSRWEGGGGGILKTCSPP